MGRMICPGCKLMLEKDVEFCGHCGYPNLGIDVPRRIKVRWKQATLFVLLPLLLTSAFGIAMASLLSWETVVKVFGHVTKAQIIRVDTHKGSKGGAQERIQVRFADAGAVERTGHLDLAETEYEFGPLGQVPIGGDITIRYLGNLSTVEQDWTQLGFSDYFSLAVGLSILLYLPWSVAYPSLRRRFILRSGTVHKSKVIESFEKQSGRSKVSYISIVYEDEGKGLDFRTMKTLPGKAEAGSMVWALDNGSTKGVAIFNEKYEWDCARA